MTRNLLILLTLVFSLALRSEVGAINIVLDYTLDEKNDNWFGGSANGLARRASLDSAAAFLSAIVTNDDWSSLNSLDESISFTDIAASTINDLNGDPISGTPSNGSFRYNISTTNRSSVAANEYIIYVGAFPFGPGTSAHAKGGWDSNDRRNAAGFALTEFNTWGGRIYFDNSDSWYTGQNPGTNPTDDYGVQDPNKMPVTDITTDDWDWNTSSQTWKGFDLERIDVLADGKTDLYATAIHEMIHVLGATSSNLSTYVGLNTAGDALVGEHLVAEYGGPVPKSTTGHFAENVQSAVWNSDGIISEVVLDPNSLRGRRKYFTKLDAALLRDLGYQVLDAFEPADFNFDGNVDGGDLARWQSDFGGAGSDADGDGDTDAADFLSWQRQFESSGAPVSSLRLVPEPSASALLIAFGLLYFLPRFAR